MISNILKTFYFVYDQFYFDFLMICYEYKMYSDLCINADMLFDENNLCRLRTKNLLRLM